MGRCFLRVCAYILGVFTLPPFLYAQDLSLSLSDLRLEARNDGAYHLFIRYKPDISSVLLTETTRDPQLRSDNYAYRTEEPNPVNGSEIRLINGYPIPRDSNIYSLVSSTPERHPELGWAYHIYIPDTLYYGYEGGRHGAVKVESGTYLNIRTFYYAYADYRGAFRDNPFMFQTVHGQPLSSASYTPEAIAAFTEIAGRDTALSDISSLAGQIGSIFARESDRALELVICLDTTGSMRASIDVLRERLPEILREQSGGSGSVRVGMVLFKDYYEEYLTRVIPFTSDVSVLRKSLNAVRVGGGGDIPEAVYEGLHAGATQVKWSEDSKKVMILIGDAPPHPRPRGKITKQMVENEIAKRGIKVYAIVLPPG